MFIASFDDVERIIKDAYKMVAIAARYGHQQRSEIMMMMSDELERFNEALFYWIEKENSSNQGWTNRHAEGGG